MSKANQFYNALNNLSNVSDEIKKLKSYKWIGDNLKEQKSIEKEKTSENDKKNKLDQKETKLKTTKSENEKEPKNVVKPKTDRELKIEQLEKTHKEFNFNQIFPKQ